MLLATEAVVLKSFPYSETSTIARIFTFGYGKITVIAKGARRLKSPFGSTLEPMNIIKIHFYNKTTRDIQLLKDANFLQTQEKLRTNLARMTVGLTAVEILDKTSRDYDTNPILFRLIKAVITNLDNSGTNELILFWFFQLQLLINLGFKPLLRLCSSCKNMLKKAVFDHKQGSLTCDICAENTGTVINYESLQLLRKLETTNIRELHTLSVNEKTSANTNQFLREFMSYHLEGINRVKSFKILDQILNGSYRAI